MATKTKVATDRPILIKVGGVSIVVRKLNVTTAHVVVVDAPQEAKISVSNDDMPPTA